MLRGNKGDGSFADDVFAALVNLVVFCGRLAVFLLFE